MIEDQSEQLLTLNGFVARRARLVSKDRLLLAGVSGDDFEYRLLEREGPSALKEVWSSSALSSDLKPDEGKAFGLDSSGDYWFVVRLTLENDISLSVGETRAGGEAATWKLPAGLPRGEFDAALIQSGQDPAVVLLSGGRTWFVSPARGRLIELTSKSGPCSGVIWQPATSMLWARCDKGAIGYDVGPLLRGSGRSDPDTLDAKYRLDEAALELPAITSIQMAGEHLMALYESGDETVAVEVELGTELDDVPSDRSTVLLLPLPSDNRDEVSGRKLLLTAYREVDHPKVAGSVVVHERIPIREIHRRVQGASVTVSADGKCFSVISGGDKNRSASIRIVRLGEPGV